MVIVNSFLQVRQTAVSYDGTTVLAACEDGAIYRWDLVQPDKQSPPDGNDNMGGSAAALSVDP